MKFNISPPPDTDYSAKDGNEKLISWLFSLAELLNVTLNCLSADNFAPDIRDILNSLTERNEESDI